MFNLDKNTVLLVLLSFFILVYMIISSNHINTLFLFFITILLYYTYAYSINCNWISLVIILWYARRITVLFYLLACYSSSINYFSIYNNKTLFINKTSFLTKNPFYKNKNILLLKKKTKSFVTNKKKPKIFNMYTYITIKKKKISKFMSIFIDKFMISLLWSVIGSWFSYWFYLSLCLYAYIFKIFCPRVFESICQWVLYSWEAFYNFLYSLLYKTLLPSILPTIRDLQALFNEAIELGTKTYNWYYVRGSKNCSASKSKVDELFSIRYPKTVNYDFLKEFKNTYTTKVDEFTFSIKLDSNLSTLHYIKPVYFKYTNFIDIYSAIISSPSSLFLILFFLPVFTYLVYFVCHFLSFRIKK